MTIVHSESNQTDRFRQSERHGKDLQRDELTRLASHSAFAARVLLVSLFTPHSSRTRNVISIDCSRSSSDGIESESNASPAVRNDRSVEKWTASSSSSEARSPVAVATRFARSAVRTEVADRSTIFFSSTRLRKESERTFLRAGRRR